MQGSYGYRCRREHCGSSRRRAGLGWGQGKRLPRGIQHLKDCNDDPKKADGTASISTMRIFTKRLGFCASAAPRRLHCPRCPRRPTEEARDRPTRGQPQTWSNLEGWKGSTDIESDTGEK